MKMLLLKPRLHNMSNKPHKRLMHSLAATAYDQLERLSPRWEPGVPVLPNLPRFRPPKAPNRAARRAMERRAKKLGLAVVPLPPAPPRKLTGAVRRGLARGKAA